MALASVEYTGNGTTTTFVVSFDYIDVSNITVTLDDVITTAFTWTDSSNIDFNVAPENGVIINISRDSDITQRLVDYADGSNLTEEDLNNQSKQSIFLQQETRDLIDTINADNSIVVDRVDQNESDIATNTANISTNTTNIATNVTNIATNTSNISTNVDNIEIAKSKSIFSARIAETGGLVKGDVVYISGSTGSNMTASKASNIDFSKIEAIAVAIEAGANNATIEFQNFGLLEGLNTSSYTEGDTIFLGSTLGSMVNVHPSGINAVMEIGIVVRSNVSNGSIFINIEHWTQAKNFDGIARETVINTSTGTLATASFTVVNDQGYRGSMNITGSNYSGQKNALSFYNEGYGKTIFYNNGNQPFSFAAEVGDTHGNAATTIAEIAANGTFSAVKLNIGASTEIEGILDEDDMSSDSATKLATQQSIKAYSDTKVSINSPQVEAPITLKEESSTPSTPSSGYKKIYPKNDGKLYTLDAAGNEVEVGSGGSGGLDSFYTEDFEVTSSTDFTTGNASSPDSSGTGTVNGVIDDEDSSPISKTQSIKFTLDASSENDFMVITDPIVLNAKQGGNYIGATFYYKFPIDDAIRFFILDQDDNELTSSMEYLKAAGNPTRFSTSVFVPSGSTGLRYGFQVVAATGSEVLVFDDMEFSTNPFVYKNLITPRTVVRGAGNSGEVITVNVSPIPFTEVEDDLELWDGYSFTAKENGYYLVTGNVSFTTSAIRFLYSYVDGVQGEILGNDTASSSSIHSFDGVIKLNQNQVFTLISRSSAGTLSNNILDHHIHIQRIPEETEHVITYNSKNAANSMVRLHTGNGHGSTNTAIRRFSTTVTNTGNAITYADSAADGASFTINEDGVYFISYIDSRVAGSTPYGLSLNSTQLTTSIASISTANVLSQVNNPAALEEGQSSWAGILEKGDIIRAHTSGATDGTSSTNFTISKIGVGDLLGVPTPLTCYISYTATSIVASTANTVHTRTLDTIEGDSQFLSLASNQITLEKGKYKYRAWAVYYDGSSSHSKLYLYDVDNTSYIKGGNMVYSSANMLKPEVSGILEITTPTTYEVRQYTQGASSNGLSGSVSSLTNDPDGANFRVVEVEITKIS